MFQQIGMSAARAEVNAGLIEAGFASLATRAGLPLEAVFQRFGLRMERPGYAPATQQQEAEAGAAPPPEVPPAGPAAPPGGAAPSGEPGAPPAATVPDSVLSAFPDMPEGEGGLLPLARFTGEEQAALEAAGLVTEATTSDGTTYRGIDPATLWPLRQARAAEGTTREPQLTPEGEAAAGVESPDAEAAAEPAAEPAPTAEADRGAELPGAAAESVADAERGLQPGAGPAAHPRPSTLERLPPSTRGVFAGLFSDAVARGFTGTDTHLADQFLERFERARVIAADLEAISHDNSWRSLLVEISKFGGISLEKEGRGGYSGEIRWLMESLRAGSGIITRSGRHRFARQGQQMPMTSAGLKGGGGLAAAPGVFVATGPNSFDTVREHLQQDPRWRHLDNLTDFIVILEDAVLKGNQENKGEVVSVGSAPSVWSTLEGLLEVREGATWWTQPDALEGDVSFDVDEFFQRLFGMPLFELADEIAEAEAAAQPPAVTPPPPAPVVAIPDVIVLPPEGALLTRTAYNASLRTTYVDEEGVARARTSRVEPQTAPIPPLGTWMVDDSFAAMDGHELEQLVEVPIDALEISEDTGADRFGDVARYARWILEGTEPPPIRVVQTDKGTLKTLDHRRLLAAKAVGARTIKAWVSWATISPRQGNPVVGLTRELATQGAGPLTVAPADPDRTIFIDDARRLETLRAELAAAGVPTPQPATEDVLDTGEVQPRLPGAEAVREQEQATPTLEAPFALTSEVARQKGTQETLFQRDPRFDPAIRLYLERGANRSPVQMAQALRDAGYRFGPMATPAEKRAGLDLLQQLIVEAEGPAPEQEFFQSALPPATAYTAVEAAAALEQVVPLMRAHTFPNRRDLKTWLQQRVRAAATAVGLSLDTSKAEVQDYLVRIGVRDALYALTANTNAIGWYDQKTRQALAVLATIHPELATDPNATFAFTYALAATSNGLKVSQNFELAERAYQHYKRTGEFPVDIGIGTARTQIQVALTRFNTLVKQWGIEDTRRFMLTRFTVSDIRRLGLDVAGEAADEVVRGAAVIGPKVGNGFFSNLNGYFDALTMDRWLMRTWGRWSGELFEDTRALVKANRTRTTEAAAALVARAPRAAKAFGDLIGIDLSEVTPRRADALAKAIREASTDPDTREAMNRTAAGSELRRAGNIHAANMDAQKEAPSGPVERRRIRAVMGRVLDQLQQLGYNGLTMADLQAVFWYPEKRLYDAATSDEDVAGSYEADEAPDYANAAVALARSFKVPQADITAALEGVPGATTVSPGRTGRPTRGTGRAPAAVVPGAVGAQPSGAQGFTAQERGAFLQRYARPSTTASQRAAAQLTELFQGGAPPAVPFYSRLIRAVEASPQGRASGAQWKATIKNAKIGINLEEYALVSVDDLVDGQTYTQAEVLEYLRLNEVKVEEITLGTPIKDEEILDLAIRLQSDRMHEARDRTEPPDFDINIGDVSIDYDEEADEYTVSIDGQEVGTFPDESSAEEAVREQEDSIRQGMEEDWWNDWEREQQQAYDDDDAYKDAKEILMDQRPANERGAMFEEYVVPGGIDGSYREAFLTAPAAQLTTAERAAANLPEPVIWQDGHDDYWMIENPIVRVRYDFRHDADGNYLLFVHEIQPPQPENQKLMPPLFLKNWRELGIKYALKVAVENGAAGVALATGQQQIDLYPSVEQEVRSIEWERRDAQTAFTPGEPGERVLTIQPTGGRGSFHIGLRTNGTVTSITGNTTQWENAPLENIIGKEIAQRIIEGGPSGALQGEGLNVGAIGLRRLYDKDLPIVAGKVIKKSGATVEPRLLARRGVTLPTNVRWVMVALTMPNGGSGWGVMQGPNGAVVATYFEAHKAHDDADARNELELEKQRTGNPVIPITAELRTQVLGGQAYFQHPHDADALTDELAQPQRPKGAKGSVRFDPTQRGAAQRTLTLSLFEGHDASTVIHEASHIFLEVMQDLAAEAPALAADLAILKAWAADPQHTGATLSEYQHEQIARAFETYVMEGRAPSVELRGMFAKMRTWMLDVYRAAKGLVPGLDRKINNDVRAVFDRLLASDEAIAEAKQAGQVVPIFLTPEAAGMSATEFELYRRTVEAASVKAREDLDTELLAEVRREQAAEYKERREEVRAAVEREVNATPVYQALAAMQKGETPDGQPLTQPAEDNKPQRLSRAIVSARFGQELVTQLPRTILTKQDGGLDPDVIAQAFGFTSGDHLLQAIVNSPARKELIEEETDTRMAALFPSLLDDEAALTAAAQAALSNESRDRVVRAELRALNKLKRTAQPFQRAAAGAQRAESRDAERERAYERRWFEAEARLRVAMAEGRKQTEIDALKDEVSRLRQQARSGAVTVREGIPDTDAFRQAAETRVAGMRVNELTPQVFWSAATKASRKATEAAARQDFDGAIAAKHQELLNLALYREARRAQVDVDKRVRRVREIARPASRARLGKAGMTYVEQIDGILERFEFAPVSRKNLRRRANILKWVEAMDGEGLPIDLPEILLEEAFRTHYSELTVGQFVDVTNGIDQIVHLARLKNRLLKNKQQRDLAELTTTLVASVEDNVKRKVAPPRGDRRPSETRHRLWGEFFASHRKLASLLRELDGWTDGGPMWEAIMRPLNEAGARETEMQAAAAQQMHALVERAFPGRAKTRLYEDSYLPAIGRSLSQMERIMVAFNWGNEGNRDRVRRGNKWTDAQVQAILDTLSRTELEFVQGVIDFLNTYWPEIAAKAQRVNGLPPLKVEAVPIVAKNGTIPGGYFPLKYDDRTSAAAIMALDMESAHAAKQASVVNATTKHGHEKARAETVNIPVRLDFGVMFEHIQGVIHDLSHHEVLIDVGRILGQRDLQQTILEHYGDLFYKQIRNTIRDVAFGDPPATNGVERALNHLRTGATIAGLGWNVTTSLLQPLGLANTWVRIGPKWTIRGIGRWLRSPTTMVQTVHWIEERSDFMRSRARTMQREINEVRQQFGVETGKFSGWVDAAFATVTLNTVSKQGVADSYFWMIQQAQRLVDVPTWLGMYEKAMAAGESEDRAVALADQAVLDSQGGGQTKDLAQAQRGTPAMKLWTNFYSFFNVLYQQAVEANRSRGRGPIELGRMLADYTMLFIVPATFSFAIREALRPHEDEDPEDLTLRLLYENISYAMGTVLLLREGGSFLGGTFGYEGPAGARAFADLGKFTTQALQGELDEAFWKALASVSGTLLHLPTGQAAKTADGIAALAEGETTNPLAVVAGGPRK